MEIPQYILKRALLSELSETYNSERILQIANFVFKSDLTFHLDSDGCKIVNLEDSLALQNRLHLIAFEHLKNQEPKL